MGTRPRPQPKYLATKLRAIRQRLGVSQSELVRLLKIEMSPARVSEYELGTREPNLLTLLAYAKVARVSMERLVDDTQQLPDRFL